MDELLNQLLNIKKRVNSVFLVSGISYKNRISKLQDIIKYRSKKRNISYLDSTIYFTNKGKDEFLKLQFLAAFYELIKNDYE